MRQNKSVVENLRWRLGLKYVVTFHEPGKGGGLALFWDESVQVDIFKIGSRAIDVIIHDLPKEIKWRCTFVYGEPRTHLRHHMWDLLKRIKPLMNLPWMMCGDFNEVMWQNKHFSERGRNEKQMMDFREVLSFCDLHDLGFSGNPWTFDNKQYGRRNVKVRLDRAVACPNWTNIFPDYLVSHLTSPRSDHCPILIDLFRRPAVISFRHVRGYEEYCEKEQSLVEEIETAWAMHKPPRDLGDVAANLSGVMGSFHAWSTKTVGSVPKKIEKLRRELCKVSARQDIQSQKKKKRIEKELDNLLQKEEIYWKQRSRIAWLKEEDRNTKFFHRKSTWRKKKNTISRLKKDDGTITDNHDEMSELATNFFKELYTADDRVQPEIIHNILQPQVNPQMNEALCKEFSDEEISTDLSDRPFKSTWG
jgi:hypothetical protein